MSAPRMFLLIICITAHDRMVAQLKGAPMGTTDKNDTTPDSGGRDPGMEGEDTRLGGCSTPGCAPMAACCIICVIAIIVGVTQIL